MLIQDKKEFSLFLTIILNGNLIFLAPLRNLFRQPKYSNEFQGDFCAGTGSATCGDDIAGLMPLAMPVLADVLTAKARKLMLTSVMFLSLCCLPITRSNAKTEMKTDAANIDD